MAAACGWLGGSLVGGVARAEGLRGAIVFADSGAKSEVEAVDAARRALVGKLTEPMGKLAVQYKQALENLKPKFQSEGRLGEILAIDQEIARVSPGVTVQEESANVDVARLQRIYRNQLANQSSRLGEAMVKAEEKYRDDLVKISADLVRAGLTADAVSATALKDESVRRIQLYKNMVSKRENHLAISDAALGRVIEARKNDDKFLMEFGRATETLAHAKDLKNMEIREGIAVPAQPGYPTKLEFDLPPGFRFLSIIGVGSFVSFGPSRQTQYAVEVDGVELGKFFSDAQHWLKIFLLPEKAKVLRLVSNWETPHNQATYWAWPRLHTGLAQVSEATGWPPVLQEMYQKQNEEARKKDGGKD